MSTLQETSQGQLERYTYQHIQGCLLTRFNTLVNDLQLTSTEYMIMGFLIGLYNKNQQKAFPSITYLEKIIPLSRSTILRTLDKLVEKRVLIILKTPGKKNSYYFSKMLTGTTGQQKLVNKQTSVIHDTPTHVTRDTGHDMKLTERTNKKISSCQKSTKKPNSDDDDLKKKKEILEILNAWHFTGGHFVIKKYGTTKLEQCIKIVEEKKAGNPGAYLRHLLELSGDIRPEKNNTVQTTREEPLINQMVKSKCWKHIPTGRILQVKPEVGEHLLIKYWKNENMVTFFEQDNFTDKLENFMIVDE